MSTGEWHMPLAVLALTGALLFASAMLKRYQALKATQRARLRELLLTVDLIEDALQVLQVLPLSEALRIALRTEAVSRLEQARRVQFGLPALAERLEQARERLKQEGPLPQAPLTSPESQQEFDRVEAEIDKLVQFFRSGSKVAPCSEAQCKGYRHELMENGAELAAKYHTEQARQLYEQGETKLARNELTALAKRLRERGPDTDTVRELYMQTVHLYQEYLQPPEKRAAGTQGSAQAKGGGSARGDQAKQAG